MNVRKDEAGRLWEVEQIYRTRLAELQRVAAAISGSREAAPDLVQEAFVERFNESTRSAAMGRSTVGYGRSWSTWPRTAAAHR